VGRLPDTYSERTTQSLSEARERQRSQAKPSAQGVYEPPTLLLRLALRSHDRARGIYPRVIWDRLPNDLVLPRDIPPHPTHNSG